jgi:hypothetical protein
MKLPTLEEYDIMCRNHDWYFSYSDDNSVWKKGHAEMLKIETIMREGGDAYCAIYRYHKRGV